MKTTIIILAIAILLGVSSALAEENNPIINTVESVKEKAINNPVTEFVIAEKNEIVEYQKESWQQGKDQLARNKEQISGWWKALKGAVRFYTTTQ
jgi:hypothetical protein|tara:strand:+ start:436 stop:720 length:285 start_codon:yes stop_codon:yes gene_type:complete